MRSIGSCMRCIFDNRIVYSFKIEGCRLTVSGQNGIVAFERKKFVYNGIFEIFCVSVIKIRASERHKKQRVAHKNFVVDNIYNDAEKLNNWIYYSQSKNVWIIDSYHMNPRSATTDEALYNDIMSNFNEALKVKNISTPER